MNKAGGWQPIETAPRDGTGVLLFTDSALIPDAALFHLRCEMEPFTAVQIGFWEDAVDFPMRKEAAGWRVSQVGEPTHWQPLPEPPSA